MHISATKRLGSVPGQAPGNKGRRYPPEPLTPDEVAAIIGQCSVRARTGVRNRALLTLLYRSGLRISEALALKPSDVDLKRHTARVLHGKGDKATVRGFHPTADDALARWIDTRRALGLRNGPLFCTLNGGPIHAQYVRIMLRRMADRAGVDKRVTPHGLRHTFADELRAAGVDVVTISKLLGHSSIAVTSRYLDHLTNHQAVSALEAVELPPFGGDPAAPVTVTSVRPQESRPEPAADPEPCPHPKARVIKGLCGACGTNVGSKR